MELDFNDKLKKKFKEKIIKMKTFNEFIYFKCYLVIKL